MSRVELSKNDVRKRWRGSPELIKQLVRALDADWSLYVAGGYAHLSCPCPENAASMKIASSPGRGDSSKAKVVRDYIAKCPEKHRNM